MTPVTDPSLLAQLNGLTPVTDPTILAQLNGNSQPNYSDRVSNDMSDSMNKIGGIWANKDLNPTSAGVQMLSAGMTGALSPVTEGVKSGYNSLPDAVTQPINNVASGAIQDVKNTYQSGVDKLAETSGGKAIGDYLMNSPHIQSGMQEVSDDAKALANIIGLGGVKAGVEKAGELVGEPLYKSGQGALDAKNEAYIQNLVRPKETPTQMAENAKNTIQVNGKNIYQPTPEELRMAKTVGEIPGVGNSLTPQGNLSAIIAEREKEAENLKTTLTKNGAQVDINGSWQPNIDQAIEKATNNPLTVVREGAEAHQGVIDSMNKAVLNNMNPNGTLSAAGLLQARKDFDQMLPPRTFTGTSDTVLGNTAKQLRNAMNKTIGDADPSAGVAESLQKQSTLYDAEDNIAPKAAGEAAGKLGRLMQKVQPHNVANAIGGVGAIGAADILSHYVHVPPSVIGTALAGAGLYKGITAPTTRVLLGKALGGGQ